MISKIQNLQLHEGGAPAGAQLLLASYKAALDLKERLAATAKNMADEAAELQNLTATGDVENAAHVARVAALQARQTMLPGVVQRADEALESALAEMGRHAEATRLGIAELRDADAQRVVADAEKLLLPFAPPIEEANGSVTHRARLIAESLPKVFATRNLATPKGSWPQDVRSNDRERFDRNALEYAEELLRLVERYMENGRSFIPKKFA